MNFKQTEKYLYDLARLPRQEYMSDNRHCSLYLKRLQYLLNLLGNPEKKIPHYIHVTGTSGKGSVCIMLHKILQAAHKKTGLSISPHYSCITERWQINGKEMKKNEFAKLVTSIKPKINRYLKESPYEPPSYFEILEAIGLLYFAWHKVQWAVLEVGLGGRYDASNVIPYKDVAVITNIGLDHENIIGPTKADIAFEKAGIIKPGCTVFTQERDEKMLDIIKAECKKTKTRLEIPNFQFPISKQFSNFQIFNFQNYQYELSVLGEHQINNAILCIEIAKSLKISDKAIKNGLAKVKLPLRMEIMQKNPLIILDGAHNPDKMKTTVESLKHLITKAQKHKSTKAPQTPLKGNWGVLTDSNLTVKQFNNLHLLVGFSADKNIKKMIKQLATLKPQTIAVTKNTTNPFREPADPKILAEQFKKLLPKAKIKSFPNPNTAFAWLKKKAHKDDIILSTGSIFVSGQIRPVFDRKAKIR